MTIPPPSDSSEPANAPPVQDQRILVTGATGYIGGRLVGALLRDGFRRVRAMARDPRKLDKRRHEWPGVEFVAGDVFDPPTLEGALAGVDVAYYLIHSMGRAGEDFAAKDDLGANNFAQACDRAGVRRIIYLGGLGEENEQLSAHLRSRHETGKALRSTNVPVTEFRAAIIVGSGSASFEIIRDLVKRLPIMICPRWVKSRCEPIAIRQVLAYLVGALREPRTVGEVLQIGGGEILTYQEMMRQCAQVMGRRNLIINVPVLTPKLSSYWLNLVTTVPFSLAQPLVEGLRNDVIVTDHRAREWIDVPALTYKEAVRLALEKEETGARETRWTDAANAPQPEPPRAPEPFEDQRVKVTAASADELFRAVQRIGGDTGWYYGDWLWNLRGALDWLLGGVGMRRGRPDPEAIHVGEPLDFWRVEDYEEGRLLRLRAEMKLPGIARLEFLVTPKADGSGAFLLQTARFWPSGLWGKLYWYAVLPLHHFVFNGMSRGIVRSAENSHDVTPSPVAALRQDK